MKNGINGSSKLKRFYDLAGFSNKCNYNFQHEKNVQWLTIYTNIELDIVIGISQMGEWICKDSKGFYELKNNRMYLYCVKLLEIPFDKVRKEIEDRFMYLSEYKEISLLEIFPYFDIVEFAFKNMISNYWFTLAWEWYKELPLDEHYKLISALDSISNIMKISQGNRQIAKAEVRKLEKNFNF